MNYYKGNLIHTHTLFFWQIMISLHLPHINYCNRKFHEWKIVTIKKSNIIICERPRHDLHWIIFFIVCLCIVNIKTLSNGRWLMIFKQRLNYYFIHHFDWWQWQACKRVPVCLKPVSNTNQGILHAKKKNK